MKQLVLFLLTVYQKILSPLLNQLLGLRGKCRYEVTCSAFAKDVIMKHGIIRGGTMALRRFIHCQPFTKSYATI